MDNREIAAVFTEMGDLLEIAGGDRYKVRAFRRVARVLENLKEPVTSKIRHGELARVPGIGEGAVHRIKQILRSGTCDDQVRLRAAAPSGVRELLQVRGIGVKTVRYLWERMRIGSVAELEAAARAGRLADLPGLGERSAEKILQAIERIRGKGGKIPLGEALSMGETVKAALSAEPGVAFVEMTGSARRRQEFVEDLDFVATATDPGAAVARFVVLPEVQEVLTRGKSLASVLLRSGRQADLWVVAPEEQGAGLHAYSGSQQHVVYLRARGTRQKLKITEHGVFRRSDRSLVSTCEDEAEVFAAVGLPFIAPELRENCGEIEAAEKGRLPRILSETDLKGDLHVYSRASEGATATPRELALAGEALGYRWMAVTDRLRDVSARLDYHLAAVKAVDKPVRLLAGLEVAIAPDGSLEGDPLQLRKAEWVIGSVESAFDQDRPQMTARLIKAMEEGKIDLIAHPTGRVLGRREPAPLDFEKLLKAARRTGVALEIHADPLRLDLDSATVRYARELGVSLALGSGAEKPEELARRRDGVWVARRGWLEKKDLLNCLRVEELLERRRDRARPTALAVPGPETPADAERSQEAARKASLSLDRELARQPLSPGMLERLETYFREGGDEPLEEALKRLSPNPVGKAYELIMAAGTNGTPGRS